MPVLVWKCEEGAGVGAEAHGGPGIKQLKPVLAVNRRPAVVRYWLRRTCGRIKCDQARIEVALRDAARAESRGSAGLDIH